MENFEPPSPTFCPDPTNWTFRHAVSDSDSVAAAALHRFLSGAAAVGARQTLRAGRVESRCSQAAPAEPSRPGAVDPSRRPWRRARRRRRRRRSRVLAAFLDLLEQAQEHVRVEGPLVRLVHHDHRVPQAAPPPWRRARGCSTQRPAGPTRGGAAAAARGPVQLAAAWCGGEALRPGRADVSQGTAAGLGGTLLSGPTAAARRLSRLSHVRTSLPPTQPPAPPPATPPRVRIARRAHYEESAGGQNTARRPARFRPRRPATAACCAGTCTKPGRMGPGRVGVFSRFPGPVRGLALLSLAWRAARRRRRERGPIGGPGRPRARGCFRVRRAGPTARNGHGL